MASILWYHFWGFCLAQNIHLQIFPYFGFRIIQFSVSRLLPYFAATRNLEATKQKSPAWTMQTECRVLCLWSLHTNSNFNGQVMLKDSHPDIFPPVDIQQFERTYRRSLKIRSLGSLAFFFDGSASHSDNSEIPVAWFGIRLWMLKSAVSGCAGNSLILAF